MSPSDCGQKEIYTSSQSNFRLLQRMDLSFHMQSHIFPDTGVGHLNARQMRKNHGGLKACFNL